MWFYALNILLYDHIVDTELPPLVPATHDIAKEAEESQFTTTAINDDKEKVKKQEQEKAKAKESKEEGETKKPPPSRKRSASVVPEGPGGMRMTLFVSLRQQETKKQMDLKGAGKGKESGGEYECFYEWRD